MIIQRWVWAIAVSLFFMGYVVARATEDGTGVPKTVQITTENIPALEKTAIEEIKTRGVGDKFFIKEIPALKAKLVIVSVKKGHVSFGDAVLPLGIRIEELKPVSVTLLSPELVLPKDNPAAQEVLRIYLKNSTTFIEEFSGDKILLDAGRNPLPPLGEGSVHRIIGSVKMGGYTFVSEDDKLERLTFGLIKDIGYVYLRGKGKVILKDGKEIKLGN